MTTLVVTTDYTIAKGQTIETDNETAVDIQAAVTFTNKGAISVTGDSGYVVALQIDATGATFINAGRFSMTTTGQNANAFGVVLTGDSAVVNSGVFLMRSDTSCNGFEFDGDGGSLTNTGRVDIQAGTEFLSAGASFEFESEFHNQGRFSVTSQAGATLALYENGGEFDNSSEMVATGGATAYGLVVMDGPLEFSNSGQITVTEADPDPFNPAAGLYLVGYTTAHIVNSGSITATDVIHAYQNAVVTLENTGTLFGGVDLADDNDEIDNSGVIAGDVHMGGGRDIYLGTKHGLVTGELHGGDGADQLTGGAKADHFFGDGGNDVLQGGKNADVLSGGTGADSFVYDTIKDSKNAHPDLITDLDAKDLIDLSRIDADVTQDGDQAFVRVDAFDGHAGEMTVAYREKLDLTRVSLDVDGDGRPDATILISGDHTDFTGYVF